MAVLTLAELKALWVNGFVPTEDDYIDLFDSFEALSSGGGASYTFSNGLNEGSGAVKLGGDLVDFQTILKIAQSGGELRVTDSANDDLFIIFNAGSSGHTGADNPDGVAGDPETQGIVLSTAGYMELRALSGLIDMQALAVSIKTRNPYNITGYGYDEIIDIECMNPQDPQQGKINLITKKLLAPSTEITDIIEPKALTTKEYVDAAVSSSGGGSGTQSVSITVNEDTETFPVTLIPAIAGKAIIVKNMLISYNSPNSGNSGTVADVGYDTTDTNNNVSLGSLALDYGIGVRSLSPDNNILDYNYSGTLPRTNEAVQLCPTNGDSGNGSGGKYVGGNGGTFNIILEYVEI